MSKKTPSRDAGPLDWFLKWTEDEGESRLTFLAREVSAELFDANVFRKDLSRKLTTLHYPQPDRERSFGKKTFYEILEHAGVLGLLLQEEILKGLWKCRLLKDLFKRDSEMREKGMSLEAKPLAEHKRKVRKIQKDLRTLDRIASDYGLQADLVKVIEKVAGECIRAWRPIMTARYPGSKAEVILSRPSKELSAGVRSEDTAIQAIIYRELKQRLQTKDTKRKGISDIFLCQLSELIWEGPDIRGLSSGETIRRAAKRLRV
jgi:hypothetical protein